MKISIYTQTLLGSPSCHEARIIVFRLAEQGGSNKSSLAEDVSSVKWWLSGGDVERLVEQGSNSVEGVLAGYICSELGALAERGSSGMERLAEQDSSNKSSLAEE